MSTDNFPLPEKLFLGLPAGIRSELLERTAQAVQNGANPFKNPDLSKLPFDVRTDYIVHSIDTGRKLAEPYRKAAHEINQSLQDVLANAQKLEKAGELQQAIKLYEQNTTNGFLPNLPYERLRIIYTKQKQYEKAIEVCTRYIEILKMVETFWPQYPNIRQIPKYQQEIKKLTVKIK